MLIKNNFLFILILFSGCSQSKDTSKRELTAIDYQSYWAAPGEKDNFEIKNDIKIAFYKDYLLYRTTTISSNAGGSAHEAIVDLSDTTGTKIYSYYVIKKGAKTGLVFSELHKLKTFKLVEFLSGNGLNFKDQPFFNIDLGKPDKIETNQVTNEVEIEMFANKVKGEEEPDSLYRYYNKELALVDFSFSPKFDKKLKSKLWKIGVIYYNKPTNNLHANRIETYWRIEKSNLTPPLTNRLMEMFNKFISEEGKWKLN